MTPGSQGPRRADILERFDAADEVELNAEGGAPGGLSSGADTREVCNSSGEDKVNEMWVRAVEALDRTIEREEDVKGRCGFKGHSDCGDVGIGAAIGTK